VHYPSYIDFFDEVLAETTDPWAIEGKFERASAHDPWYIHLRPLNVERAEERRPQRVMPAAAGGPRTP
jgi:hypothetical protein